jgi:hypothetical protein
MLRIPFYNKSPRNATRYILPSNNHIHHKYEFFMHRKQSRVAVQTAILWISVMMENHWAENLLQNIAFWRRQ